MPHPKLQGALHDGMSAGPAASTEFIAAITTGLCVGAHSEP